VTEGAWLSVGRGRPVPYPDPVRDGEHRGEHRGERMELGLHFGYWGQLPPPGIIDVPRVDLPPPA